MVGPRLHELTPRMVGPRLRELVSCDEKAIYAT